MNKSIFLTTIFGFFSLISLAQTTFYHNGTQNLSSLSNIDCSTLTNAGVSIPIDETFKKYDLVAIEIQEKWSDGDFTLSSSLDYEPNSQTFTDNYGNSKQLNIDLYDKNKEGTITVGYNLCDPSEVHRTRRVVVKGYYKDGTETYWSDYSESYKTRNTYEYSKNLFTGDEFTFKLDSKVASNYEASLDSDKRYDEIKEYYNRYMTIPMVGNIQPNVNIYDAYLLFRYQMQDEGAWDRIEKVEKKLIGIMDDKLKSLNKTLKDEEDISKIENAILNF